MIGMKLALLLLIIIVRLLPAQQDSLPIPLSSDHKDTIIITQDRLPTLGIGHHYLHLGETVLKRYQSQNLAQVLQLESSFFVKNYGPSNINSLSGRGGGASHTAVLWEGFNIQSPMLGQADISLLPSSFVDYLDIQYGGASALFGNSSIGGALHLGTRPTFNNGWQFEGNLHGGSFEQFGQQLKLAYSNNWYAGSIRSFYKSALNNYPFKDINAFGFPKPIKEQNNAALEQWGLLQDHLVKLSSKHQLGLKTWYQTSKRQIPPPLLVDSSNAQQQDQSLRLVLHWRGLAPQQVWKGRTALFLEQLHYQNDQVNSLSQTLSSITEVEHKWYIHQQHLLNTGLNYSFRTAQSSGYKKIAPQQHRAALFLAYKYNSPQAKWKTVFSVRTEAIDGRFIRPAVSLGSTWFWHKKFQLNLHLSHNYRLPTFNDLYWDVLGNPNLKPEYSWNSELGFVLPFQVQKSLIKVNLTAFCNLVDNWILWAPNTSNLWRPSNVEQVWARGLECHLQGKTTWNKWQLAWGGNYAFTQSTRTKGQNAQSIGKQLIYTPTQQGNLYLRLQYIQTSLLYQHNFTAHRYIDTANEEQLPFFQVAYLRLQQQLKFKHFTTSCYVQINNLWGEDYQIVSNRAMPWQQFELGLGIQL